MTTYVIKKVSELDDLSVADLIPFVDGSGRLDVRIEGGAVTRPFAVLNVLRSAGFLHTHTWVEADQERGDEAGTPVTLRVTAALPPDSELGAVAASAPRPALFAVQPAARREPCPPLLPAVTETPTLLRFVRRPWRSLQTVTPVRTERAWPLTRSN